jgi:precorrin-6Y C5,15-methyltransferase (decarboxylating)
METVDSKMSSSLPMPDAAVADSGATPTRPPGMVTVVGLMGQPRQTVGVEGRAALASAELVLGGRRELESLHGLALGAESGTSGQDIPTVEIGDDADDACRRAASASRDGVAVCMVVSGDPGFFGIVASLVRVVDRRYLRILPAPSSVSLAFARLALPWDDAAVVCPQGGRLGDSIRAIRLARKAAVLTSPASPPEAVGRSLVAARAAVDMVAVCSRLGHPDESVTVVGLHELATGTWDPFSVVVLVGPAGRPIAGWGGVDSSTKPLAWGLPDNAYAHRDGLVTEAEVRAVALGKLALPAAGVLWDVGAGSGSVAVEAAVLCPGITIFAIEERDPDVMRITANAASFGADVRVIRGHAPEACEGLPDPDRVFVGGGGLDVLDSALARLRPGGRIVATFSALDRATGAADRLGNLTQISTSRGHPSPDGSWQLAAADPVFLAWGPESHEHRVAND